jgi:hypothetical protein
VSDLEMVAIKAAVESDASLEPAQPQVRAAAAQPR